MNELLSIIIPTYNSEKYICSCLNSILESNYTNIEVIIIDDSSTDSTVDLINNLFIKKNSKVKLFTNKENRGPGFCRRNGINLSNGKFIAFVDSDDTIEKNMFEKMIYNLNQYNADIVECGYKTIDENDLVIKSYYASCFIKYSNECIDYYLKDVHRNNFLCNKIFRKEIFCNTKFPDFYYGEDSCVLTQLYTNCKILVSIEDCMYNYRNHINSTCNNKIFSSKKLDLIKAGKFMYEYNAIRNRDLSIYSAYYICSYAIQLYFNFKESYEIDENIENYIINNFEKYYYIILNNDYKNKISLKRKIILKMFKLDRRMTYEIFKIYKKLK